MLGCSTIKQCFLCRALQMLQDYSLSMLQHFIKFFKQSIARHLCLITLPHAMCSVILGSVAFLATAKSQTTKELLWVDRECPLLLFLRTVPRSARAQQTKSKLKPISWKATCRCRENQDTQVIRSVQHLLFLLLRSRATNN